MLYLSHEENSLPHLKKKYDSKNNNNNKKNVMKE